MTQDTRRAYSHLTLLISSLTRQQVAGSSLVLHRETWQILHGLGGVGINCCWLYEYMLKSDNFWIIWHFDALEQNFQQNEGAVRCQIFYIFKAGAWCQTVTMRKNYFGFYIIQEILFQIWVIIVIKNRSYIIRKSPFFIIISATRTL